MSGYLYILVNPSMKGFLKIGMTERTPEQRAEELSKATGVPYAFHVAYEQTIRDCRSAEREVHRKLAAYRVNEDREFFKMALKDAVRILLEVGEQFAAPDQIDKTLDCGRKAVREIGRHESQDSVKAESVTTVFRDSITCKKCGTQFRVTIRRGEQAAICPTCSTSNRAWIP